MEESDQLELDLQSTLKHLNAKLGDLATCQDLIGKHSTTLLR